MIDEIFFFTLLINIIMSENNDICVKCVAKCCPNNQYVVNTECESNTLNVPDFSEIDVYDEDLNRKGNLGDHLTVVTKAIFKEDEVQNISNDAFIYENASLVLSFLKDNVIIDNGRYCVDFYSETVSSNETQITFWFLDIEETSSNKVVWLYLKLSALFISSFFLLLVIIAYLVVKKLRDLKGKIRLAFVTNLFGAYISIACLQVYYTSSEETFSNSTCLLFSTIIFYFYWASNCWMNVSIYNIWVSLRRYRIVAVNQPEFRDMDKRVFLKFCAYAFGAPLVLVFFFNLVYYIKDTSKIANTITSNGECSLTNTNQFLYYLNAPILLSNLINCVLYVHIAQYLWIRNKKSKRDLKNIKRKETPKISFFMHLKIWTLTGVTWIMEVISVYFKSDSIWFKIFDLYNILTGIGLFIIILCNKQTFLLIYERFNNTKR